MNDTLIDLYRGVQGRRGEWKKFDSCWHPNRGMGTITAIFREAACLEVEFPGGKRTYFHTKEPKDLLWLPPIWSDDGRCLIGMIERDFSVTRIWYDSDDLTTDDGWIYGVDFIDGEFIGYYNSLPEALLRAIREQEAGDANG